MTLPTTAGLLATLALLTLLVSTEVQRARSPVPGPRRAVTVRGHVVWRHADLALGTVCGLLLVPRLLDLLT